MPKYVILVNWTEQGAQSVTETTKRAEQVQQMVAADGRSHGHARCGRRGATTWWASWRPPMRRLPPPSVSASA